MVTPRMFFHVGTIIIEGEEKMFALAGSDESSQLNTVHCSGGVGGGELHLEGSRQLGREQSSLRCCGGAEGAHLPSVGW